MPRTQSRIEVTLRDGTVVLGKATKYGPTAKTFANRTQAINAALQHSDGDVIHRGRGRPFYVRLLEPTPITYEILVNGILVPVTIPND